MALEYQAKEFGFCSKSTSHFLVFLFNLSPYQDKITVISLNKSDFTDIISKPFMLTCSFYFFTIFNEYDALLIQGSVNVE